MYTVTLFFPEALAQGRHAEGRRQECACGWALDVSRVHEEMERGRCDRLTLHKSKCPPFAASHNIMEL